MSQVNLSLSLFPQPRMDQYFNQMEKIVKERKTSSRIRFMLQDVIDLRLVSVCAFVLSECPASCSAQLWFMLNFPTVVCFIDLSDHLEHDIGYSAHILLRGCTAALVIEF